MERQRLLRALGLVGLVGVCWLYALHLFNSANQPLHSIHHTNIKEHQPPSIATSIPLDDSNDKILTFVHASDLHISRYNKEGGIIHFLHFLHTALPLISPRLVTVTGDLTDGKDQRKLTSLQQILEWQTYRRALNESGVLTKFNGTFYRDQRGNHDCFNVYSYDSPANYFRDFGATPSPDGYRLQINESFGQYSFVATDGCPSHGFARPLNFFGYLDGPSLQRLQDRLSECRSSNHTFLLNHYPLASMVFDRSLDQLLRQISVFMSGHLHQLVGDLGSKLQAYKAREGYWDLEITDMKEHAVYRVYAVDHDLVSFVDVQLPLPHIPMENPKRLNAKVNDKLEHPPVVLVTNPKDARYLLPRHEPLELMRRSKFIRMLVWADGPVKSVTVWIDGKLHPHAAQYRGKEGEMKTPLWIASWDPSLYDDGQLHEIEVMAVDQRGKITRSRTPFHFTPDLVPLDNAWQGGWLMKLDAAHAFRDFAIVSYLLVSLVLLLLPRLYYQLKLPVDIQAWLSARMLAHDQEWARIRHIWATLRRCPTVHPFVLIKLVLALLATQVSYWISRQFAAQVCFVSLPWLFWPMLGFTLGLSVLPIFSGILISSAGSSQGMGSVYAYGIYIGGQWSPLLDTWTYAMSSITVITLLLCYLPTAVLPHYSSQFKCPRWIKASVLVFLCFYMALPSLIIVYTYGWTSVWMGYSRSWLLAFAGIALYWY